MKQKTPHVLRFCYNDFHFLILNYGPYKVVSLNVEPEKSVVTPLRL